MVLGADEQAGRNLSEVVEVVACFGDPQAVIAPVQAVGTGGDSGPPMRLTGHDVALADPLDVDGAGVVAEDGVGLVLLPVDAVDACCVTDASGGCGGLEWGVVGSVGGQVLAAV